MNGNCLQRDATTETRHKMCEKIFILRNETEDFWVVLLLNKKIKSFHIWRKVQVKLFFTNQKCPVRLSDQAEISPVETSNLPDHCPLMTDCYLQAWNTTTIFPICTKQAVTILMVIIILILLKICRDINVYCVVLENVHTPPPPPKISPPL